MPVIDHLSYGDKAEVGDHDHAVARIVIDLAVAGVMNRNDDRRKKPGPQEESHSYERRQSLC
ncbi:MAG: hypothetical protein ACOC38_02065 [Promethearchaeia archaeon]